MIDSITVEGFKSIASVRELELGPINVLIGPNGSGKSNFIGVFSFLHAIRSGRLQEYVNRAGGAERILFFGSRITPQLTIHIYFRNRTNQYEIKLDATDTDTLYPNKEIAYLEHVDRINRDGLRDTLYPNKEIAYFWIQSQYEGPMGYYLSGNGGEAGISEPSSSGVEVYVQNYLNSWRLYHFHDTSSASPMRKTTDVNDNRFLRADASNLAAFLYFLRAKHETAYSLIRRTVQLVAPFFDDFLLQPLALNEDKIRLEWRHKGSDAYFDASSFSDGTLRFIALATLLLQPEDLRPSVILLDEPELGLHPYAITLLASLVKQTSAETQVILATQSPILLDHFQPEDVIVAERAAGQSHFRRLDADSLKVWLKDYSLGQLWEKNEIGGRPAME